MRNWASGGAAIRRSSTPASCGSGRGCRSSAVPAVLQHFTRVPVSAETARRLTIGTRDVHVWTTALSAEPSVVGRLAVVLDAEERARSQRFAFGLHHDRFIVMRGVRRMLLARYTGVAPEVLRFAVGPAGKPQLLDSPASGLEFNEARSEDLAVYALAHGRRVGVDLEKAGNVPEREQIIRAYASAGEQAIWSWIPRDQRSSAFIRWWTAKEAYVKALGSGLLTPLDSFTVAYSPKGPLEILDPRSDGDPAPGWWIHELATAPGFIGAVVTEGPVQRITCRSWRHEYHP
jgi:4'-phosphopantetheinyl transferase